MNVSNVMERIQNIDLVITKITKQPIDMESIDMEYIAMILSNYKECLKLRKVEGSFDKSN